MFYRSTRSPPWICADCRRGLCSRGFLIALTTKLIHPSSGLKQMEWPQGPGERAGALKQASCQDKAMETGMDEQRHLGRLAGPASPSCFVSVHSSQHRAGVCGLHKDVFQLTGPGSSFRTDTLFTAELSRASTLTQPLELLLIHFSLPPAHCVPEVP